MKGLRLTIAKQTVSSILDTLGDDDFFNIIAVSMSNFLLNYFPLFPLPLDMESIQGFKGQELKTVCKIMDNTKSLEIETCQSPSLPGKLICLHTLFADMAKLDLGCTTVVRTQIILL